jgi:hypothetical protein
MRLWILLVLLLAGCSSTPPQDPTAKVKGEVMLDGKPVAEGQILFAREGKTPSVGQIIGGKYEATVRVGLNRVSFVVTEKRDQPKDASGPGSDQPAIVNVLPDRYTTNSTISLDVQDGSNTFDYLLKTK